MINTDCLHKNTKSISVTNVAPRLLFECLDCGMRRNVLGKWTTSNLAPGVLEAAEKLAKMRWNKRSATRRIKMQPYFGKDSDEPKTIKFRRPVPELPTVMDDVVQDSIRYGMGMMQGNTRIEPGKIYREPPEPIYTLEDICWKTFD